MIDTQPLKELLEKHQSLVAEKAEVRELLAQIERDFEEQPAARADIPLETRVQVLSNAVPMLAKRVNALEVNIDSLQEALLVVVIRIAEQLEE